MGGWQSAHSPRDEELAAPPGSATKNYPTRAIMRVLHVTRSIPMSKARDSKKADKKAPVKSPKEKKAAKEAKKVATKSKG